MARCADAGADRIFYAAQGLDCDFDPEFSHSTLASDARVRTKNANMLVVYDGDSSASVTQTGPVLSGVTLAQLNAFGGSNFISHV